MRKLPLFDLVVITLFLLFLGLSALQIFGFINLSWWLITAPLTVPGAVVLIVLMSMIVYGIWNERDKFKF